MYDVKEFLKLVSYEKIIGANSILGNIPDSIQGEEICIQEVAGRDSYAAFKFFIGSELAEGKKLYILSVATAPTEFGNWEKALSSLKLFESDLLKANIPYAVSFSRDISLWRALVARPAGWLQAKYGFYTPCIACHAYLHLLRGFIAIDLGARCIISGERTKHDSKVKLNQTTEALNAYADILKVFLIDLMFPIAGISNGKMIADILGKPWDEEKDQMECVFSENYLDLEEGTCIVLNTESMDAFLKNFLIPVGKQLMESYSRGNFDFEKAVLSGTSKDVPFKISD